MTKQISFQTWNRKNYLCADRNLTNARLVADRTEVGEWELFTPVAIPNEKDWYALQSTNGCYVTAEEGGGRELVASRNNIGPWEKFRVVPNNDGVALQSINGYFVCAEQGGGGIVIANRTAAGVWETFFPSASLSDRDNITQKLITDRQIFRLEDGTAYRHKGITAFNLLDLFSRGIDIHSYLDTYKRYKSVRIFPYVPVADWGARSWDIPSFLTVKDFIQYLGEQGWRVQIDLCTDNNFRRIAEAKALLSYLNNFGFKNLVVVGVNEPYVKGDNDKINPQELKNALTGSNYLYSSGVYCDLKRFYGKFGVHHSPRDNEWVRKAKDVVEAYGGGGPNYREEPPCKVPWILDEPIRPDQVISMGFSPNEIKRDYYTYGLISSGGGAGATFHCQSAKFSEQPTDFEYECSNALADGLDKLPDDLALQPYNRIPSETEQGYTLRTYEFGSYVVRVRPKANTPTPSNWQSMDEYGVLYKKV